MARITSGGLDSNYLSGSVGPHTFRISRGQLVVSQKVAKITDARTFGQIAQRAKWLNVPGFAQMLTRSGHHFVFEDKAQRHSDVNIFYKYALKLLQPVYINKEMHEAKLFVPAPYVVSRGSLSSVETAYDSAAGAMVTDLRMMDITAATDVGDFSMAVTLHEGWKEGDRLTCLILTGTPRDDGYIAYSCRHTSVTLRFADHTPLHDILPQACVVDGCLALACDDLTCLAIIHERDIPRHGAATAHLPSNHLSAPARWTDTRHLTSDQHLALAPAAAAYTATYQSPTAKEHAMQSLGGWKTL